MTALFTEVEDIQQIGQSKLEGSTTITEIMAQPYSRARTIAKLSNYLVAILNDRANSNRIIGVAIVERQSLLLHTLGRVDDLESS
jgi:hypothetical protein